MEGTVSIALGYGRSKAVYVVQVLVLIFIINFRSKMDIHNILTDIKVGNSSGVIEKKFVCVQHHHTLGVTAIETSTGNKINADEAALVDDAFKP